MSSGFDLDGGGVIHAGVSTEAGLSKDRDEILKRLPADLRPSVRLSVSEARLAHDEDVYGGMRLQASGTFVCTSGWSVTSPSAITGISGAGHCDLVNQAIDPGQPAVALSFRGEHRGAWGDVEWYSSGQAEPAQFFSDNTTVRPVHEVEARAKLSVNEPVCHYGRATGVRNCALSVERISQSCTNGGVFNQRLVLMNGDVGTDGDSGGPWSYNNRAYGAHKGNCAEEPGREVFTLTDYFDEAIGTGVMARDRQNRGETMVSGEESISPNGSFTLRMQSDGNLVLYQSATVRWCSCYEGAASVAGARAVMQSDGNFVMYSPSNAVVWQAGVQTVRGLLLVQDDGNIVIYDGSGVAQWVRP